MKSLCVIAKSWQHVQGYARPRETALSGGLPNSSKPLTLPYPNPASWLDIAWLLPSCWADALCHVHCVKGITLAGTYPVQHAEQDRWQQAGQVSGQRQSCAGACTPASWKQRLNRGWRLAQTLHLDTPEQLSRRGVVLLPDNQASCSTPRHS